MATPDDAEEFVEDDADETTKDATVGAEDIADAGVDPPADAEPPARIDAGLLIDLGAPPPSAPDVPGVVDQPVVNDRVVPVPRDAGAAPVDAPAPTCPIPVEVVVYSQGGWNLLAAAFHDNPSVCANYWLSIPSLTSDRTMLRAPAESDRIRRLGPRFHALAEFSWGGWAAVPGMTWFEKGVEFRRRMVTAGYDVASGDAWAINELPSTVRYDPTTRANVRAAMRGLYTGPAGSRTVRGAAFVIGFGQSTEVLGAYKRNLENWITDAPFWVDANRYAQWWGQEVYPDPAATCVGSATVGERAAALNTFLQHVPQLASATGAPPAAATARSYLGRTFIPLMTAVWQSPAYQTGSLSLAQMQHFVSSQVYATRVWAAAHNTPDGRIAFAWDNPTTGSPADARALADRLAAAIAGAYGNNGGRAARACGSSTAYTWCRCTVAGATFNRGWGGFSTW